MCVGPRGCRRRRRIAPAGRSAAEAAGAVRAQAAMATVVGVHRGVHGAPRHIRCAADRTCSPQSPPDLSPTVIHGRLVDPVSQINRP
eukprot:scaffold921_cov397-Prasinococcus_capsulatus_cf.AAC.5